MCSRIPFHDLGFFHCRVLSTICLRMHHLKALAVHCQAHGQILPPGFCSLQILPKGSGTLSPYLPGVSEISGLPPLLPLFFCLVACRIICISVTGINLYGIV